MEIIKEVQDLAPQVWLMVQNCYSFNNVFLSSENDPFTDESYLASMEVFFSTLHN